MPKVNKVISIIKKVFGGIIWGLFGVVFVVVAWLAIDKFIIGTPVPSFLGYASLTIETGSMNGFSALVDGGEPKQVNIGDMIIIKDTGDYKIGDVITFLPEGDTIPTTHRIISYTEDGYITKGDANNVKDTVPISKDRVLGEVVLHLQKAGLFAEWVKTEGWLYLVSILVILALGTFILKPDKDEPQAEAVSDNNAVNTDGIVESNNSKIKDNIDNTDLEDVSSQDNDSDDLKQ